MLNNITIEGRIVSAPVMRYNNNNVPFVTFCIANDRDFNREITDFLDCIAFNKTAMFINDYFGKGNKILLRGSVQTSKWTDNNGSTRKDWKIAVEHAYFMESARNAQQHSSNATSTAETTATNNFTEIDDESGEVPF